MFSKIFVFQKKAVRVINTNAYFKCNKILKLSDQYKLQVYTDQTILKLLKLYTQTIFFKVLHSNIDEEMESSLLINNKIHSRITRTNNQMSILRVNRSKTKHIVCFTMV